MLRLTYDSCFKFAIQAGMLPERLQLSSDSIFKFLSFPISGGNGAEKKEFKITKASKFMRFPIQEFDVREKSPYSRVRNTKFLMSPIHENNDSFNKTNRDSDNSSKESKSAQ